MQPFKKNKIFNIKILKNSLILFLGFFLYFVWLFKTFTGNVHSNYIDLQKFFNGQFPYNLDFVLNSTYYFKITILYDVLKFFKINLDNDYVGFFIHITTTTLKGFFLFLILGKIIKIKSNTYIIIIIFSLMTIGHLLVEGNGSSVSWVSQMTFSTSYFGQIFRLIFLYFLLIENFFFLTILSTLMILIGLKTTYFIIGCGILYSIFFFEDKKKLIWVVASILVVLFFFPEINKNLNFKDKIFIIDTMIIWDNFETVFHLQPKFKLFLLVFAISFFPFLLKKLESEKFKRFSLIVYILSIINFIGGFIYFKYLYELVPIPQIALLSPTRSMETFQMIFWIVLAVYITKIQIPNLNKIIFFLSIFLIHLSTKGLIIASGLIVLNFFDLIILKKFKFRDIKNKTFLLLVFFLMLSPIILYLGFKKFETNFNFYSLKKLNKWSFPTSLSKEQIDIALNLQNCKDFILYYPGGGSGDQFIRTIAGKSRFLGHPIMNVYDTDYLIEVIKRSKISSKIENQLKNSDNISLEDLKDYKMILLIEKKYKKKFSKKFAVDEISKNYYLLYLLEENEIIKFKQKCLKKIT